MAVKEIKKKSPAKKATKKKVTKKIAKKKIVNKNLKPVNAKNANEIKQVESGSTVKTLFVLVVIAAAVYLITQ